MEDTDKEPQTGLMRHTQRRIYTGVSKAIRMNWTNKEHGIKAKIRQRTTKEEDTGKRQKI